MLILVLEHIGRGWGVPQERAANRVPFRVSIAIENGLFQLGDLNINILRTLSEERVSHNAIFRNSQDYSVNDLDCMFLENPVQNYISGMMLTYPITACNCQEGDVH